MLVAVAGCGRLGFGVMGSGGDAGDAPPVTGDVAGDAVVAPGAGLVAWYRFDEGSGTTITDSAGTGNDELAQTYNAAATAPEWTTGHFGGGLTLFASGQDSVDVNVDTKLVLPGAWTVSAWVSFASLPASGDAFAIVVKPNAASQHNYALFLDDGYIIAAGALQWVAAFHDVNGTESAVGVPATVTVGSWYHVVGTWDGSNLAVAVDGQGEASGMPLLPPSATSYASRETLIGRNECCAQYLDGTIDDVRIYDRALAPAELAILATQP